MAGFWENILGGTRSSSSGRAGDPDVVATRGQEVAAVVDGNGPADGAGISYSVHAPRVTYLAGEEWAAEVAALWAGIQAMTPGELWRTQPHLRTVVGFVARNIAQVGLHVFERVDDNDRRRDRDNDFARALADPGDRMTTYRLIFALVADKMLYDRAYWLPWTDDQGKPRLRRIPPSWVKHGETGPFAVQTYKVTLKGGVLEIPADRLIEFGGYSPASATGCSPAVDALKETLGEQIQATKYRAQVWEKGGRASAVIERPIDAPAWTDTQADRFREDWYANYTGDGPRAGGTPILEDGMVLKKIDHSAKDMEWAAGATLAFSTVASVFHVNPTMVGILENANYSNVREFRRMLYGDTLGPYLADVEGEVNTFALAFFDVDPTRFYAEFNIGEKLQGSFEEQAAVLQSAIGRPYMTADEGRGKLNLPALGGDAAELVTPLNVLVGGQASPRDGVTGGQGGGSVDDLPPADDPAKAARRKSGTRLAVKARANETVEAKVAQVVSGFFDRQAQVVRTALGAKAGAEWWDGDRWDRELGGDLLALAVMVTKEVSASVLDAIGFEPDVYDTDRTLAWLKEVSDNSAASLNATTKAKIDEALAAEEDPEGELAAVFDAQESRAAAVAASSVTLLSSFATVEATKQAVGEEKATKTWLTGSNARPAHAAMDGETVLLSENFSNGAAWPGDGANLGADDLAGCNCELQINIA